MSWPETVTVLSGGVGGSKFLRGLADVLPPEKITAVVNTGDDITLHGLHISPDIDIVLYSLAGIVDEQKGWGVDGDSFRCLGAMKRLGMETWFMLGDADLATHIRRTQLLDQGLTLSEVTRRMGESLGVGVKVIPMSDDKFETHVRTAAGWIHFQEYLVKRQMRDEVLGIDFVGKESARPSPGVLDSVADSDVLIFAPSNPLVSTGTILSLHGVRETIMRRSGPTVAVSPVIGNRVVRGPLLEMMKAMKMEPTSLSVARMYRGLVEGFVVDRADAHLTDKLREIGVSPLMTNILMTDRHERRRLAKEVLGFARTLRRGSEAERQR